MANKQLIIAVSREYGSGGHVIAEALAKEFDLPLYDYNLLHEIAEEKGVDYNDLINYDESPHSRLLSRTVRGHNNSPSKNIAELQFNHLKRMADSGKSFVIVGRCAENVLKGHDALISIFVLADPDVKTERIARLHNLSIKDAENRRLEKDWKRKKYHNTHCPTKWGDSRNYDISINSTRLGIEETAEFLKSYVKTRIQDM